MRSAEEWFEIMWQAPDELEYIKAIQRDALNAAAEVCDMLVELTITTWSPQRGGESRDRLYPMPSDQIKARILALLKTTDSDGAEK